MKGGVRRFLHALPGFGLVALLVLVTASAVMASTASEEQQGMRLLRAADNGSRDCRSLSSADFELVGEYVMGRMAGSTSSHARMNTLMESMIGNRGEEQMHALMGRRFTSCGGGRVPG